MRIEPIGTLGMRFGVTSAINTISKSKQLARIAKREKAESVKKKRPIVIKPDWMGLYVDFLA